MSAVFYRYKYFILVLLGYMAGFFIIRPFGEFPLNDDWSYAWSVRKYLSEGVIDIGSWPAMTLVTHILWGSLFSKIFGFSFLTLRISTWVSVVIGMFFFEKLLYRISGNKAVAAIGVFAMLFNPIFFNVSHSFMTDANFFTVLIISINLAFDFFNRPRLVTFLAVFFFGFALLMIRQYGIIVPAGMLVACVFLKEKRTQYLLLAVFLFAFIYWGFLAYEGYLRTILPPTASYQFTGKVSPLKRIFWDNLRHGIESRHRIVAIHGLFHTLPLTLIFLPAVFRRYRVFSFIISALVLYLVYRLYRNYPLQVGNVFLDMSVGADTTYETLKGTYYDGPHFFIRSYEKVMDVCKIVFITLSSIVLLFFLKRVVDERGLALIRKRPPHLVFLVFLFFAYIVLILITESFFDRYQIPVIALSLCLFAYSTRVLEPSIRMFFVPACLWFYVSVFGTLDYFELNNRKWGAYYEVQKKENVPGIKINGGFEIASWNDGYSSIWYQFMYLTDYDYLIQFKKEDSFAVFKEYPYRRYYPFMMDTLRVFKRNIKAAGKK